MIFSCSDFLVFFPFVTAVPVNWLLCIPISDAFPNPAKEKSGWVNNFVFIQEKPEFNISISRNAT